MKIAVTYEGGSIFQHFGKTETFKMYEVEDGKITSMQIVHAGGAGHSALAGFLSEQSANVLICGGIGEGAQEALKEAGIKVISGAKRRSRCGSECLSCRRTGICRYKL